MPVDISQVQGYGLYVEPARASVSEIQGYALYQSPNQAAIRQIAGYAVATAPAPLAVRQFAGYAITNGGELVLGKTGFDAVFDAILNQSKTVRPRSHFNLFKPEPFSLVQGLTYNTRVKITPNAAARLSGEMYFHYNRNHISSAVKDPAGISIAGKTKTHDLIPLINAATGYVLTTDDIVNEDIPANSISVQIKAADTSYMFIPGTTTSVGSGPIEGPAWMLFDMENNKELSGNVNVTAAYTNATLDDTLILDNRKSMKIPSGGQILLTLGDAFDPNIPEWTLEYTVRTNVATSTYLQIMSLYLASNGLYPGVNHRTSDSGFGLRWQVGQDFRTQALCYHPNFQQNTKVGVTTTMAFVKRSGVVTVFIDGKPQTMAAGTGSTYNQPTIPWSSSVLHDTIRFGATTSGMGLNVGAIRISKFARYRSEYTPKPLLDPPLPTLDSLIPVGKLDGFDPQS